MWTITSANLGNDAPVLYSATPLPSAATLFPSQSLSISSTRSRSCSVWSYPSFSLTEITTLPSAYTSVSSPLGVALCSLPPDFSLSKYLIGAYVYLLLSSSNVNVAYPTCTMDFFLFYPPSMVSVHIITRSALNFSFCHVYP